MEGDFGGAVGSGEDDWRRLISEIFTERCKTLEDQQVLSIVIHGKDVDYFDEEELQGIIGESHDRLCGRVCKRGELAYQCKTCGLDPTCAICIQCFRDGDHRGHDYSMFKTEWASCDCGDAQAWDPKGFCKNHRGLATEDEDPSINMPEDFKKRLLYACCVAGETILTNISEDRSNDAQRIVEWMTKVCNYGDSIRRVVSLALAAEPTSDSVEENADSILSRMFRLSNHKGRLDGLFQVMYTLLFQLNVDFHFKACLLQQFTVVYDEMLSASDKDIGSDTSSMDSQGSADNVSHFSEILEKFTVQIFTVPSLAPAMIREQGLLDVVIQTLKGIFVRKSNHIRTSFTRDENGTPMERDLLPNAREIEFIRSVGRVLLDLDFILSHSLVINHVMHRRLDIFEELVNILSVLQSSKLSTSADRSFDRNAWNPSDDNLITLEHSILCIFEKLVVGFEAVPENLGVEEIRKNRLHSVTVIFRLLVNWIRREKELEALLNEEQQGPKFHIRIPLHRLFSLFANSWIRMEGSSSNMFAQLFEALRDPTVSLGIVLDLIYHPLKVLTAFSEILSQTWTNPRTIWHRTRSGQFGWIYDLDINLLQMVLSASSPEEFESRVLSAILDVPKLNRETIALLNSRRRRQLEDAMAVFVRVLLERARAGFNTKEHVRHTILHLLFSSDRSHSELLSGVPQHPIFFQEVMEDQTRLNTVANEVVAETTDFIPASGTRHGVYRVKDHYWRYFNPFDSHMLSRQRDASMERFRSALKLETEAGRKVEGLSCYSLPLFEGLNGVNELSQYLCRMDGPVSTILDGVIGRSDASNFSYILAACLSVLESAASSPQLSTELLQSVREDGSPLIKCLGLLYLDKLQTIDVHCSINRLVAVLQSKLDDRDAARSRLLAYFTPATDAEASKDLRRKRREEQLKRQEEIRNSFLKRQADFMKDLDDDVEDLEENLGEDEMGKTNQSSVDDYLKDCNRDDVVCVYCHQKNVGDQSVLGLIGFAQLTLNLKHSSDRLRNNVDAIEVLQTTNVSGQDSGRKTEEDERLTLGRDEQEQEVLSNLESRPFVAISGEESGSEPDDPRVGSDVDSSGTPTTNESIITKTISVPLMRDGVAKGSGLHVNFCGHYIHNSCLEQFFRFSAAASSNDTWPPSIEALRDREKGEFLCPLCRRLSNSFVPLIPPIKAPRKRWSFDGFSDWKQYAAEAIQGTARNVKELPQYWQHESEWFKLAEDGFESGDPNWLFLLVMPEIYKFCPSFFYSSVLPNAALRKSIESAAVSIATKELVLRSGIEPCTGAAVAQRTLTQMLYSVRSQALVKDVANSVMSFLWNSINEEAWDPFGKLIHLVLLWPEELLREDVVYMIRLCARPNSDETRSTLSERQELVYLRRASLLLDHLCGNDANIQAYNSSQEGSAELRSLRQSFGITQPGEGRLESETASVTLPPLKLANIPLILQTLLEKIRLNSSSRCESCGRNALQPALCLVCSSMIFSSSIGLFLMLQVDGELSYRGLRRVSSAGLTSVLLFRDRRFAAWCSPYLDEHGEEDIGLVRGKPLYLSEQRYAYLERLWLSMGLDYDPKVVEESGPPLLMREPSV